MIHLYNTRTKSKEVFKPLNGNHVGLYTCGPTVYHYAHIGNLRTYIFEDILKRTLKQAGYHVNHVMNITDVGHLTDDADSGEDKMEKGARREGKTAWDVAQFYTDAFQHDITALNIEEPSTWCKATDHIGEQIEMVQVLIDKGYTYETSDGIYFDTTKFPTYGDMANLKNQSLEAGSRVDMGEKKHPHDFALWKFSKAEESRQMEWDAPFGSTQGKFGRKGFPGWHIECSAMARKYLGDTFDIHCGGIDHVPIHHTNEIAQTEAVTGKSPSVNFWMHGEFLTIEFKITDSKGIEDLNQKCPECSFINTIGDGGRFREQKDLETLKIKGLKIECKKCKTIFQPATKMSKSEDNFLTIQTLIEKGYDPLAYRYFLLQAHYRKQLAFSWEALDAASTGLKRLRKTVSTLSPDIQANHHVEKEFYDALAEDLNTASALAVLWGGLNDGTISTQTVIEFDKILGLDLHKVETEVTREIPAEIQELLTMRGTARDNKDWAESDRLRDEMKAKGFEVKDTGEGQTII